MTDGGGGGGACVDVDVTLLSVCVYTLTLTLKTKAAGSSLLHAGGQHGDVALEMRRHDSRFAFCGYYLPRSILHACHSLELSQEFQFQIFADVVSPASDTEGNGSNLIPTCTMQGVSLLPRGECWSDARTDHNHYPRVSAAGFGQKGFSTSNLSIAVTSFGTSTC